MKRLQWHELQNFSQPPLLPRPIKFKLHGLASRTFLPPSDPLAHVQVPLCCGSHPAPHLHRRLSPSCPLILWTPQHFVPPATFWDLISRPLSESTLPQVHWLIRFMGHFPWSCASRATTMGCRPEKSSLYLHRQAEYQQTGNQWRNWELGKRYPKVLLSDPFVYFICSYFSPDHGNCSFGC